MIALAEPRRGRRHAESRRVLPHWVKLVFAPRWIALAIAVVAFSALCWSVLAPWQLGKNTATSRRNHQISASVHATPVPAAQLLGGRSEVPSDSEWHKVTITGRYLSDKQVLARLRNQDGNPAYEVLVPFAADDHTTYLVDRGYVRSQQGAAGVPAFGPAPSGVVTVIARIRAAEHTDAAHAPRELDGYLQAYAIDPVTIGKATGVSLAPGYLALTEDQPGLLGALDLPQLDAGPYLSYGLQWTAFGVMAPAALCYFLLTELRRRREEREELAAAEAAAAEPDAPPPPAAGAETVVPDPVDDAEAIAARAAAARSAKLADRYGRKG